MPFGWYRYGSGPHLGELGTRDEGTVLLQSIALGSHRLQVSLNFEGDGGLFDNVKRYRFNMRDELAFVSKGAQDSKIVIEAYKRGDFTMSFEKRPHLKFDGDYSQGVALNLSAGDLQELERLRKEREVLENKLAMIDNMGTGIKKNKAETEKFIGTIDRLLHEVKIKTKDAKAQVRVLDQLLKTDLHQEANRKDLHLRKVSSHKDVQRVRRSNAEIQGVG